MSTIKPAYATNIKRLRKSKHWTQARLGMELHYSGETVSKWERGEMEPKLAAFKLMAEIFETSIDDIAKFTYHDKFKTEKRLQ